MDTSAVAKLFLAEAETPALRRWLAERPAPLSLVASALMGVELIRLLGLFGEEAVARAEAFLSQDVDLVQITPATLDAAAGVPPPRLRTLDAIHLATALDLADALDVVLTYDKVLADAAEAAGLTVAAPGG